MSSPVLVNGVPLRAISTNEIFKYKPFSYTFAPTSSGFIRVVSTTTLLTAMVSSPSTTQIVFQSPGYLAWNPETQGYTGATSSSEQIVIGWGSTAPGGVVNVTDTFTFLVNIRPGTFEVPASLTLYQLYLNESVDSALGSNIQFYSPGSLAITTPFTSPALPPGLTFTPGGTSPNLNWYLTGTPLVSVPATIYTVYGKGTGSSSSFTISTQIRIAVGPERVAITETPSSNVLLTTGSPIVDTTITATYPNSFTSNLSYSWSFLPDGLRFVDSLSNTVTSPFRPGDANSTIILTGTPSVAAAQLYRSAGVSNVTTNLVATRQTAPTLTSTQPLNLTFGSTVLFDPFAIPQLYVNKTIDPSSIPIQANTYFPFEAGMTSIAAPSLPAGLSLVHSPGSAIAYLEGTPTSVVSNTYAITATNSGGTSQTSNAVISVALDTITFTGPSNDICYNFVISRPLGEGLTGYYPSNITYTATASSGANVTLSVANLSNVGITTTIVGSSLTLSGVPDTLTSLTTAVITATSPSTAASATRNLNYAILTDDVSITNPTTQLVFFQNQEITPVQFEAATLSGRSVINWTSSNLPTGLLLSGTGRLTGTPANSNLGSTFDVVASTGYVSDTNAISYQTIRDDALVTLIGDPVSFVGSQFSNVEITAVGYSGETGSISVPANAVAPIQPSSATISTIDGLHLSGNLATATIILPEYRLNVQGNVGSLFADYYFKLSVSNTPTQRRFIRSLFGRVNIIGVTFDSVALYTNESSLLSFSGTSFLTANTATPSGWNTRITNLDNPDNSIILAQVFGASGGIAQSSNSMVFTSGGYMWRSTDDGETWSGIRLSNISRFPSIRAGTGFSAGYPGPIVSTIASDGGSNWISLGVGYDASLSFAPRTIIRTSTNDGITWTDTSLTTLIVDYDARLYHNNGRYFLANRGTLVPTDSYRADISTPTTWVGPAASPAMPSGITAFAFSNDTVLAGGGTSLYTSGDNGTNWSNVVWSGGNIQDVFYSDGIWHVAGSNLYKTTDISSFTSISTDSALSMGFDGASLFYVYESGGARAGVVPYDTTNFSATSGSIDAAIVSNVAAVAYRTVSNVGPVTGTITAGAVSSTFLEPTSNDFALLQFASVNIPVEITPTSNFIYYYATGLPQGLRLVLDMSGTSASIVGNPTQYNPNYQTTTLYAREPVGSVAATFRFTTRVLSPFVVKPQSGASGYTAFLRQYAEVNGAQNGRDSVAFPVQENPIGKFTSPGIVDVVTDSNCLC